MVGRAFARDGREFTRVYERLREFAGCLNQDLLDFLDFRDAACLVVRTWLDERLREMDVRLREMCECLRVVWTAVLVICVMGCDLSLAGAGVLVPLPARVVRELDVSCRVMSGIVGLSRLKSGKVG